MNQKKLSFVALSALSLAIATVPSLGYAKEKAPLANTSPDDVLKKLRQGNDNYVKGEVRRDGQGSQDIQRLSTSQAPGAVVLSCSDSRVPPELVFDQKLGEIFTVRTAGQSLSPQVIASVEFAVAQLGSRLILVMGHTQCGAVQATLQSRNGKTLGSASLDQLAAEIRPRLASSSTNQPSADLRDESWMNTRGVARDLLQKSEILTKAQKDGKLKIAVALYDLKTGRVKIED